MAGANTDFTDHTDFSFLLFEFSIGEICEISVGPCESVKSVKSVLALVTREGVCGQQSL